MRGSRKKISLRGTTTNELHVEDNGDGTYDLVLCDDTGELDYWPFTDLANSNIAAAMHTLGQFIQGGDTQLYTFLEQIVQIDVGEGQSVYEATEAMVQCAFNSEEFFFLNNSIFTVTGDEVLLDCMEALADVLVAL